MTKNLEKSILKKNLNVYNELIKKEDFKHIVVFYNIFRKKLKSLVNLNKHQTRKEKMNKNRYDADYKKQYNQYYFLNNNYTNNNDNV